MTVLSVSDIKAASLETLRNLWLGEEYPSFLREEAVWEYWSRLAEMSMSPASEDLKLLLSDYSPRSVDAVRLLVRRDKLGTEFGKIVAYQQRSDDPFLNRDVCARQALMEAKAGGKRDLEDWLQITVDTPVFWAVVELVRFIEMEVASHVIDYVDSTKAFSRGQRHQLRVQLQNRTTNSVA